MSGVSADGALVPACRRIRSVGQVGRKSETTLGIARLQLEISAFAGARSDQFDEPAMAADGGHG